MSDAERELIDKMMQIERASLGPATTREPSPRPTIHYAELPEDTSGPIAQEWNYYRREVGRLLAEGHEGDWVLIKGEVIVGIWKTMEEADRVHLERYFMQNVLMKQVLTRDPVIRGPIRPWGRSQRHRPRGERLEAHDPAEPRRRILCSLGRRSRLEVAPLIDKRKPLAATRQPGIRIDE